jgi:SAM-dependent methyltransferase
MIVDYGKVAPVFDAMRTETIGTISVAEMVGGGPPLSVAVHFMSVLLDYADLSRHDRVLDVGCGCGRLAAALTQHLSPTGMYCGVDIVADLIDFANRHIKPLHPNFRFLTLEKSNPAYDGWRGVGNSPTIGTLAEACEVGTVDLCLGTSLFTHLDADMAIETLAAMRRALAPDGRVLISLFLLDNGTRSMIARGRSAFRFEHEHAEGIFVQDLHGPLGAVAFEHSYFVDLLTQAGLYVEKILYGGWPGRPFHVSGQDILIARAMLRD